MINNGKTNGNLTPARPRPLSPNIQIYRPQLTSVLSIANRVTGLILSLSAVGLVVWLSAAVAGPRSYGIVQSVIESWIGQVVPFGCTFAFFLHLCGGIRHLVWDTVPGFELRSIYISRWTVVGRRLSGGSPCLIQVADLGRDRPPSHRSERQRRLSGSPHRHAIFRECASLARLRPEGNRR